uniref:HEAT repeat domain-containing protein n=1 Tax=Candidatus Desulfatibia profunda TaxID=2841695 RepID=A0A8J6TI65_9BACT|nr:HEAT repeat domain-containing protein [Candidatus Desulfatibia profunda]
MSIRTLKKKIHGLLLQNDVAGSPEMICRYPARQVINPLFSFLFSADELVKWRAVTAIGVVVAGLAEDDMESARIVMRRLIWNLNDESGGIGWGSPEAMGEIMARHQRLAEEYAKILVSYIRPNGNFIEHQVLQRGVLWSLGRLARVQPRLVRGAAGFLRPYLESDDPSLRGLAAWTARAIGDESVRPVLKRLLNDNATVKTFLDNRQVACQVSRLAREALKKL